MWWVCPEIIFPPPFYPTAPFACRPGALGWGRASPGPPSTIHLSTEGRDGMGQEIPQGARSDPESVLGFSPTLIWEQMKESEERAWWSGCM